MELTVKTTQETLLKGNLKKKRRAKLITGYTLRLQTYNGIGEFGI